MSEPGSTNPAEMYEEYFVTGIHGPWTPLFLGQAAPRAGERVLDVACGTGVVARQIARNLRLERLVGVDINPEMLDVARSKSEPIPGGIEWQQGDAHALPFADEAFELALCQQGLQFFSDPGAALREMRRVVAPGGRAAVSVWRDLELHPLYEALCRSEARHLGTSIEEVATPFMFGDTVELRRLLEASGFRGVEIRQLSRTVQFPQPKRFITLTLLAAASIIPESDMDANARAEMVRVVSEDVNDVLQEYMEGDVIKFPMYANVAVAQA